MDDFIDKGLAALKGFSMLEDWIERNLKNQVFHPDAERDGLAVVILDGTQPYNRDAWIGYSGGYSPAILLEHSFNEDKWPLDYRHIARGKGRISWRTKMFSGEVVKLHPELLEEGDAKYQGAVYYHGLVVSCSGVKSWWDEALSMSIAAAAHAFMLEQMEEISSNDSVDMIGSFFR